MQFAAAARWIKDLVRLVGEWWGIMAGGLLIPFLLLSLFNLPTLANLNPPNLAVFVFDNQAYSGTRISVPTATAGKTDLALMGKGAGIEHAVTVRELKDFQTEATGALNESGLRFVVCKIQESLKHRDITRSNIDLLEIKYRFVRYLEKTENKPIFLGRG